MNPITALLMSRRKADPPRCPVCHGRKFVRKPWKRNSQWVFEDVPCDACQGQHADDKR